MFAGFGLKATSAVVHFCPGCIFMTSAVLSVIAFLALFAWRFVFAGLRRGALAREIAPPPPPQTHNLKKSPGMLQMAGGGGISDNPAEKGSNKAKTTTPKK